MDPIVDIIQRWESIPYFIGLNPLISKDLEEMEQAHILRQAIIPYLIGGIILDFHFIFIDVLVHYSQLFQCLYGYSAIPYGYWIATIH